MPYNTYFINDEGQTVPVSASNPLPVAGVSGGSVNLNAEAPLAYDAETETLSIDDSGYAAASHTHEEYAPVSHTHEEYAAVSHTHAAGDITSGTFSAARIPTLATSKVSGLQAILDDFEARIAALETPEA